MRNPICPLLICLSLLVGAAVPAYAAEAPPLPFVVGACVRAEVPPVIDGKLDDACWQRTQPLEPFVKLTLGTLADEQSTAYLVYDDKQLYIGVHCDESQVDGVKADITQRDGPVYGDDCIEIFLIPPDSPILAKFEERIRYFHLVTNTLGTRYDEIGLSSPRTFDGEWEAKASIGADNWELEVAVPFSELGTRISDGAVWTGNVSRARWQIGEYSTWAPIKRTFHDKKNFGRIVFTRDLAATQAGIHRLEFTALQSGLLQPALQSIASSVAKLKKELHKLPDNCKPTVERGITILNGQLRRLRTEVEALTPDDFRLRWQGIYRKLERLGQQAKDREDEASMLAATGGRARPWKIFITKAITNDRLLGNRWPRGAETLPRLSLTACPGEYESATFSVYAVRDLMNLQAKISDLKCGRHILPAACVEPYAVKCWYQGGRSIGYEGEKLLTPELLLKDDDLVHVDYRAQRNSVRARPGADAYLDVTLADSSNLKGLVPRDADTLLPLDLPAMNLKQFWLTAHIPEDTAPGLYRGHIRISAEGVAVRKLRFQIRVLPFKLADPMLTYSIYYRAKLSKDGKPTITSEYKSEEQYRAEIEDLKAHGVLYPSNYQWWDDELLPRVLEIRREVGMPGGPFYNLGCGAGSTTDPAQLASKQEEVKRWLELCKSFGYDEVYFYGIDEARGEQLASQRASWQAVQEAGGKTFVACYKKTFEAMGSLLNCAVFSGQPDPEEAEKWHSVGSDVFCYGNPQVGVEEPETYRRNFGLLLWKAGFDGAMDYAYQHSFTHGWNDFDNVTYRDHNFTYPTVNGVVGTIQWEGFREGVDDVRYLTTLMAAVEEAKEAGGKRARLAEATESWIQEIDPGGDLDAIRQEMIRRILELRE